MTYNINIKIIGDTWDNQEIHDRLISGFKNTIDRILFNNCVGLFFRGNINYHYLVDEQKFIFISVEGATKEKVDYELSINSEFQRKYIKKAD